MQSVRRIGRIVSFPSVAYGVGLLGFIGLGGFVAALAGGHSFATPVGIAAAVAFVLMILFFRMASFAGTDANGIALSSDLLVATEEPGTDERYLARYRSAA